MDGAGTSSSEAGSVRPAKGADAKSVGQKSLATTPSAAGDTSLSIEGPFASAPNHSAPVAPPAEFGRYRLIRLLGEGAMGTVYLAEDTQLLRQVALKIPQLGDPRGGGGARLERFYREARLAATLHHPNICPIHDVGEHAGTHFISMAFIRGKPLATYIRPDKLPAEKAVAAIVRKIALALHEAHAHGVIHRDLKPANIMIDQRGEPIVMDFGLARQTGATDQAQLTHAGAILGTPAYMSPEQVSGQESTVGQAADTYALGVILYQMLTGRLPFEGSVVSVLAQIATQAPAAPSSHRQGISPVLESICLKAMARQADDRFESMAAFAVALTDYLRATPTANTERTTARGSAGTLQSESASALPSLSGVDRESVATTTYSTDRRRLSKGKLALATLVAGCCLAASATTWLVLSNAPRETSAISQPEQLDPVEEPGGPDQLLVSNQLEQLMHEDWPDPESVGATPDAGEPEGGEQAADEVTMDETDRPLNDQPEESVDGDPLVEEGIAEPIPAEESVEPVEGSDEATATDGSVSDDPPMIADDAAQGTPGPNARQRRRDGLELFPVNSVWKGSAGQVIRGDKTPHFGEFTLVVTDRSPGKFTAVVTNKDGSTRYEVPGIIRSNKTFSWSTVDARMLNGSVGRHYFSGRIVNGKRLEFTFSGTSKEFRQTRGAGTANLQE